MTYHVSMICELLNPGEKERFQKHDGGKKTESHNLIFNMTHTENKNQGEVTDIHICLKFTVIILF